MYTINIDDDHDQDEEDDVKINPYPIRN